MHLSPKIKRNLIRILPFGLIWLITGSVFLLSEAIVTGNQNLSPDSSITMSLPVFIFASATSTIVGLLVGLIELVVFEKRFASFSFARKVVAKFFIYMALMLIIMVIAFPLASSIELNKSPFDPEIWRKTANFFQSLIFVNTVVQISFQLILCLLYAAISENLGYHVLLNFFTGRYHHPKKEQRIFMFLDMKSSTTIAEQLGHDRYFNLLHDYYEIMSDPIINTLGEVYQYIGDEVVITWDSDKGLANNNCIKCFEKIKYSLKHHAQLFEKKFGLVPDFKAGMHLGEVTTGEIGALKKEVIYTGDVLNTTARVQGLCKEYQTDLIITEELLGELAHANEWKHQFIGELSLRGKSQSMKLHSVTFGGN
ncbi:MAG: adenylate/guanylate cyclase domain-containing protein [Bacteroidota bacterium]